MAARVLMADAAAGRLAELGLTIDLVERVVRGPTPRRRSARCSTRRSWKG
jgi:hypothetical protein